jgi:propanol-preferring alcohol dehydrogenase
LRTLSSARIIAVDVSEERCTYARELGAEIALVPNHDPLAQIMEFTHNMGADAVFDFVGTGESMQLAIASWSALGTVSLVGAGGGKSEIAWGKPTRGCRLTFPMGASREDLSEVLSLAEGGNLVLRNEFFSLSDVEAAYSSLRDHHLTERPVVVPDVT